MGSDRKLPLQIPADPATISAAASFERAYGRGLAKTIMRYVYDYLRQGCDVYAWWERGRKTAIFCQNQECFFQLFIQPKKQEYVKMGPEAAP